MAEPAAIVTEWAAPSPVVRAREGSGTTIPSSQQSTAEIRQWRLVFSKFHTSLEMFYCLPFTPPVGRTKTPPAHSSSEDSNDAILFGPSREGLKPWKEIFKTPLAFCGSLSSGSFDLQLCTPSHRLRKPMRNTPLLPHDPTKPTPRNEDINTP
ncbi:hypothetical protein E2320_014779 [Naja naja]|nr:hypothetical protein E2320_014779 [Naja naja]